MIRCLGSLLLLLVSGCKHELSRAADCALPSGLSRSDSFLELVIGDPPVCPGGALSLRLVARLGDESGPGELSYHPQSISIDSRGRFLLLGSNQASEVPKVFGVDGRFLQALGRIGDGPGEFRSPAALLVGAGDSIFLLDASSRTMTVWTPNLRLARTTRLDHRLKSTPNPAVYLTEGRIAANVEVPKEDSLGPALQIIDRGGIVVHQFGDEHRVRRRWIDGWWNMKTLGWARGGFWSGTMVFEYRMERWDSSGARQQTILRQPEWFQRYDTLLGRSPDTRPSPVLIQVREDSQGLLWAIVLVPDSNWAEGLSASPVRGEGGTAIYQTEDPERVMDSYIEVMDPRSGRLLLSRRFDGLFTFLINDTLVGKATEIGEGVPAVEVYQVHLRGITH